MTFLTVESAVNALNALPENVGEASFSFHFLSRDEVVVHFSHCEGWGRTWEGDKNRVLKALNLEWECSQE